MILTPAQLIELTARRRVSGQRRALDAMGIPYRQRHDGTLVVMRIHAEAVPGENRPRTPREPELRL